MDKMEVFLEKNFLSVWHHVLLLTYTTNSKLRDNAVKLWFQISKAELKSSSVLTYSLISELTSLSIETVRRQIKKVNNKKLGSLF